MTNLKILIKYMEKFGKYIKSLRLKNNLLLRQAASGINIDQAILSKIEKGSRNPTKDQIEKLANIYQIDIKVLMTIIINEKYIAEATQEGLDLSQIIQNQQSFTRLIGSNNPINLDLPFNELPLLPPPVVLTESVKLLKHESRAAVKLAELKGLANTLPNPNILINAIVLKEAEASSEIENVMTTQDKLYEALASNSLQVDEATKEVLRYRESIFTGFETIKSNKFLSPNNIIELQSILENSKTGIRKLPGTVLKNSATGKVIYTPPDDPKAIDNLLKNYAEYVNIDSDENDTSYLIKLAVQHYQFESIHPFYDGNGRTGRIINVLYLILKGLLDSPILYLSGYIINNKAQYYKLLQEVRTLNDWESWIIFILEAIEISSVDTIDKIHKINLMIGKTIELVKSKAPQIYSKELVELLFEHPYCKIEFLEQRNIAKRKTASKYLQTLEELGILEQKRIGKETIYVNLELFELFRK